MTPTYHYNSSAIRRQWKQIREVVDGNKIPTNVAPSDVAGEVNSRTIRVSMTGGQVRSLNGGSAPVLVANTFHPNWQRTGGQLIYATTPFYMLTFVDQSASIRYSRGWFDKAALWISGGTLVCLCLFVAWRWTAFRRRSPTKNS